MQDRQITISLPPRLLLVISRSLEKYLTVLQERWTGYRHDYENQTLFELEEALNTINAALKKETT